MKKGTLKVATFCLVSSMCMTSFSYSANAALLSSVLPAAGGALVVGEGVSVKDIEKKIQNDGTTKIKNTVKSSEGLIKTVSANTTVDTASTDAFLGLTAGVASVTNSAEPVSIPNTGEISNTGAEQNNSVSENDPAVPNSTNPETEPASISDAQAPQTPEQTTEPASISENHAAAPEQSTTVPTIEVSADGDEKQEEDFSGLMIAQVTNYVNIRDRASEEGEVVGKLYNNSAGEWLGAEGDWYKIKSGDVSGYVKAEFVVTGDAAVALAAEVGHRTAVVTTTTLKVRQDPSTEATVLGLVPMEDELSVIEETENWVKVSIEEGDGWVSKEFVNVFTDFVHAESKAAEEARLKKEAEERKKAQDAARKSQAGKSSGSTGKTYAPAGSGTGSSVAGFAMQFVGNPYVYGGTSLTNGTDCSGFTMSVYRNFGVSLPHSSGAQRNVGYDVGGIGNAQPGDLVCYSGHVALYIGNGQIVHASTAKTGIKVSNANYRNILAVRRIF